MKSPCKDCLTFPICINQKASKIYEKCETIRRHIISYEPDPDFPHDPVQNWMVIKGDAYKNYIKEVLDDSM